MKDPIRAATVAVVNVFTITRLSHVFVFLKIGFLRKKLG